MRRRFDVKGASPAAGCLTYLVFSISIIGFSVAATNITFRLTERAVLKKLYGVDAYDHGLRVLRKGPGLSDGRVLPREWMWAINGSVIMVFFATTIVYVLAFHSLTGFPPGEMGQDRKN